MEPITSEKQPIINCHTHIFTGDHVPPLIARKFLIWPLYYIPSVPMIVDIIRWWCNYPLVWRQKHLYKRIARLLYLAKILLVRTFVLYAIATITGIVLTLNSFYIIYDWLANITAPEDWIDEKVQTIGLWLRSYNVVFAIQNQWANILIVLVTISLVKFGRNILFLLIKRIWKFLGILPGKQTKELFERYINIGRFARYKHQGDAFVKLKNQYPPSTGFIVLPMDMEFMGAGKIVRSYHMQMQELARLKRSKTHGNYIYPFVFIDPRRIAKDPNYFSYSVKNGKVILKDCFIKRYIEDYKFSGFKIYPALGYYPFDPLLLPLWKYAADNQIPIMTHCIRGTIFYRGPKQQAWDRHPVFDELVAKDTYKKLLLSQIKNKDFSVNFTHPLNFLCLLNEWVLRKYIGKLNDPNLESVFGYLNTNRPMEYNLSKLKICFGHFGGDDEWQRFFESDRDNYSHHILKHPLRGIDFLHDVDGNHTENKIAQIWSQTDWYSIICSLMLQHPNVYADISYILHDPKIIPLLKHTLQNDMLKQRVLFGSDFYVVRNHKSDKNMLADTLAGLSENEFDLIARINPRSYLFNYVHGNISI